MSTTMGQTNYGTGQTNADQTNKGPGGSHTSQGHEGAGAKTQSQEHAEGTIASMIERQTAKLPSDTFLWAALGSMGASALFRLMGKKHASLFVGDWVAPLLLFGVYNKIVKTQGSDRAH